MHWFFRRRESRRDAEFDSELSFHIEKLTEENIAAGMTPEEARREALIEFGGHEQMKEEMRDVHRLPLVDTVVANLKAAIRLMQKSPAFSTAVILTLALGIDANSSVFSALDSVLLRPLAFPQADELTLLYQSDPRSSYTRWHARWWRLCCAACFPAIRGTRREIACELAHGTRSQVSRRNPLQWILVGVQVALAVTLLVGAGLLLRSFQELGRVSAGFDFTHMLTFSYQCQLG